MKIVGGAGLVALLIRSITMLLSFITTIMLTKVLSPEDLSNYWILLSGLAFVALVAHSGVGQVAMSLISQAIARNDRLEAMSASSNCAGVVLLGALISSGVAVGVIFMGVRDSNMLNGRIILLFLISGLLFSAVLLWVDFLRAQQRLYSASCLWAQPQSGGVLPNTLLLGMLTVFFAFSATLSLIQVLIVLMAGWILMMAVLLVLIRHPVDLQPKWSELSPTRMLHYAMLSWPVVLSGLALFVVTQADLWFVNRLRSAEETVAYGLAGNFVKYVSSVNVLIGALLPGLVGQYWAQRDHMRLAAILVKLTRLGAGVSLLVVIVIFWFGKSLLVSLVGVSYAEGAWLPLFILSIGHLANSMLGYSHILLVTSGQTKSIFLASVLAGTFTIIGLYVVTPYWGGVGAAIVSSCGLGLYNLLTCVAAAKITGIWSHIAGGYRSS